ncbi:hypothetical protein RclHR1_01860025 [Rhizophagus clarus]|uniref:Uncharacterized protein n=1 Tax=Rhizophagus clarus TaxID=94130 RepID=A0A2Z6R352_9GLOM|nr:hypothetical protein RclHR1_01860025 [Rhizophagus clarus]GES79505.1 hypothetical protein GLOIN_2v1474642 [Rhizophagus clarus]
MKLYTVIIGALAVLTALVDSSPLPQAPAPAPAPPAGGEKKIVVVGPGAGPWTQGSQQVCTWWSTGFSADEPVTVITREESGTTPIFSQDSTLNKGSLPISIDNSYTPGTNYVSEVALKSDPSVKGTGPTFTVSGGGGGPAAPGPGPSSGGGSPPPGPGGPPPSGSPPAPGPGDSSAGGSPPPGPGGPPPSGSPPAPGPGDSSAGGSPPPGGPPPSGGSGGPGGPPPAAPKAK